MAPDPKPFTVQYIRDGGVWAARARVAGKQVEVAARTLESARSAMADEAAPLLDTYASNVAMYDKIELADECTAAVAAARSARAAALEATARAQETLRTAARLLVVEHGLSYRDAAYVLGVSHPRVQQVLGKE